MFLDPLILCEDTLSSYVNSSPCLGQKFLRLGKLILGQKPVPLIGDLQSTMLDS